MANPSQAHRHVQSGATLDRSYVCVDVENPRVLGGFGGCGSVYLSPIGMGQPMSSNARRPLSYVNRK